MFRFTIITVAINKFIFAIYMSQRLSPVHLGALHSKGKIGSRKLLKTNPNLKIKQLLKYHRPDVKLTWNREPYRHNSYCDSKLQTKKLLSNRVFFLFLLHQFADMSGEVMTYQTKILPIFLVNHIRFFLFLSRVVSLFCSRAYLVNCVRWRQV